MQSVQIKSTKDHLLISIDKKLMGQEELLRVFDYFQVEKLAQKAQLNDEISEVGEQMKADWWEKNKDWFLSKDRWKP